MLPKDKFFIGFIIGFFTVFLTMLSIDFISDGYQFIIIYLVVGILIEILGLAMLWKIKHTDGPF
jgi:hypothetical protein